MRRFPGLCTALWVALLGVSSPAAAQGQARPNLVLREVVEAMPRGERQEVQILTAIIGPGQSTVFPTHRFPVTVHVLGGTFTLEMEGRETVIAPAGRSMAESPNLRMTGHNHGVVPPSASETLV